MTIEQDSAPVADPVTDSFPVIPQQRSAPENAPSAPRGSTRRSFLLGAGVGALVVLLVGGIVVGIGIGGPATPPAAQPASAAPAAPAAPLITVPNLAGMTGEQAYTALISAGFRSVTFGPTDAPRSGAVTSQGPTAGTQQTASTPVYVQLTAPVVKPPEPHRAVDARDWLLIAKAPDSHIGERIVIHGHVTQFDSATGTSAFRASVDGIRHKQTYQYVTNTLLRGSTDQLKNVVTNDQFKAEVTVGGSFSYDTQIGGNTTVPVLQIDSITVL